MFKNGRQFVIVSALISLLWADLCRQQAAVVAAETWRLEKGQDWKPVDAQRKDKYLLEVAQIKQLVNTGQTDAVRRALAQLKEDFPQIAGPDLDAFVEAEMLFCKGKFVKAVRRYDKFLAEFPDSEFRQPALDRQFAIATAFLAGRRITVLGIFRIRGYASGEKIMEKITDSTGDAPIALKAAVAVAESLEKREKFEPAYHKWSQIASRWPTGQTGKDALLAMARCKHAAYAGPRYSASNLISAKSYYENFKLRYPEDAENIGIENKLKQIDEQLAYKHFSIGRYYERTGSEQPANLYYQMVIDSWPDSSAAKMVRQSRK
jgi:outer membrane protein assembly factor BamD (BamD/ComL family)